MVDWYKRSHEGRRIIDDNKRSGRQTKEESDIHNVKAIRPGRSGVHLAPPP